MPLILIRNEHDDEQIEILEKRNGEVSLWTTIFVNGLEAGAVGKLADRVRVLRHPTRVVIVLEEEWQELKKKETT